mgnify:CR=1 FL=1
MSFGLKNALRPSFQIKKRKEKKRTDRLRKKRKKKKKDINFAWEFRKEKKSYYFI